VLAELEKKLASLVGDAVAARPHLSVLRAGTQRNPPQAGRGQIVVGVQTLDHEAAFRHEGFLVATSNGGTTSRRVLDVGFGASLAFLLRPANENAGGLGAARTLLMDDVSLVGHALGDQSVRTGAAFVTAAPDPGFLVRRFELGAGTIATARVDALLTGELRYTGEAAIWPPGVVQDEGVIATVDLVRELLPLTVAVDEPVVVTGDETTVRIRASAGRRVEEGPIELALTIVSDLPPDERGAITSGAAGVAGARIVPVTAPETLVVYRAPEGDLGAVRSERIAVHLARPDGAAGVFLGSAPVLLREDV
jgi:hypothetical protein